MALCSKSQYLHFLRFARRIWDSMRSRKKGLNARLCLVLGKIVFPGFHRRVERIAFDQYVSEGIEENLHVRHNGMSINGRKAQVLKHSRF